MSNTVDGGLTNINSKEITFGDTIIRQYKSYSFLVYTDPYFFLVKKNQKKKVVDRNISAYDL